MSLFWGRMVVRINSFKLLFQAKIIHVPQFDMGLGLKLGIEVIIFNEMILISDSCLSVMLHTINDHVPNLG